MAHPEDELERLTKKMLFDMDNPPSDEYFGERSASENLNQIKASSTQWARSSLFWWHLI